MRFAGLHLFPTVRWLIIAVLRRSTLAVGRYQWTSCSVFGGSQVSENIIPVSDDTFEQDVLQSDIPVLVDYWAEWCGPCKMIAPILDEIAGDYSGKLKIVKLNIDENPNTPPKFGIRGIPTLMIFKNGTVEATKVGALSKSQLTSFLDENT